jgi:hypothetical protein
MAIVGSLAPIVLLIALGAGLTRMRFLGVQFMADLNKLAFWIALPALLFRSAANASRPGTQTWILFVVLLAATLAVCLLAWGVSVAIRLPRQARGTLMQAAYRGNLAFIGIPVLAYGLRDIRAGAPEGVMSTAVIAMTMLMAVFNALAVVVLHQGRRWVGRHDPGAGKQGRPLLSIATNPLLIAGLAGLVLSLVGLGLPSFLDRTLEALGAAAVPIALLCIGGSLVSTPMQGRASWTVTAALLKVAVTPLLAWLFGRAAGLGPVEMRIALVLAACPTAAASYIMVKQMGGDETLASGSIALSTLLSALSLAAALWVTAV